MTREERLKIVHYLFAAAWADGALSNEEGEMLATLLSAIAMPPDELAQVKPWFSQPPASPDWNSLAGDPTTSEAVLRQAMVLTGSDLSYSVDEIQFLERLGRLAGVSQERFQTMWREVEALLVQGRD